jgi:hypothetical protein
MMFLDPHKRSVPRNVETNIEISMKPSQIILVEGENNNNPNCLSLSVS